MTRLTIPLLSASLAALAVDPASAAVIDSVSDNDGGTYTLASGLTGGSGAYSDNSSQTWENVPSLVDGAQYVQTAQNDNSNSDLEVNLSIGDGGDLFVFHADSVTDPGWLTDNFSDTGESISLAGDTTGDFSIFSQSVTSSSSLTLFDNDPDTSNTERMYGIAATLDDSGGGGPGPSPVPVPASLLLLGSALFGGGMVARRRART